MAYQSGRNVAVTYKEETAFGILPGPTDAKQFRVNSGGISLAKEPIRSGEVRRDGQTSRGRHGSRSATGGYTGDLSVGTFDDLLEAVFRGTFEAAITVDDAGMGAATLTIGEHTITASAGSFIDAGLRVGDVIRAATGLDAANLNRNLRIVGLTATVITVAETLTVEAGPIAAWSLTRSKKLIMGTTPRSFTVEEHEYDIDGSEVFKGVRIGSMQLRMQPNGMATLNFGMVGQDMEVMEGEDAPYFTDATTTTSIGLTAVEAKIMLGGEEVIDVTSVDLTLNLNANGQPVVGSVLTPDVFTNTATIEGTVTALKKDVSRSQQFLNETELSLHLLFEEPETGAADFCSFFIGNLTLASATKGEIGSDNGRTQQFSLLVGKDERGGAYSESTMVYQTSAT